MYGTETRSKNVSTGSINITKKQKVGDNNVTNTGAAVMSFIQMPNKLVHVPNKLKSIKGKKIVQGGSLISTKAYLTKVASEGSGSVVQQFRGKVSPQFEYSADLF